jgi:PAS domain S-box-containing protein
MQDTITTVTASSARCAVLKIGLKGRFVYVDDRAEELLGYTREALFGKSILDYLSPESNDALERFIHRRTRFESSYEILPLAIRDRDGSFRRFDAIISLNFVNGNPVNYQIIVQPPDATRRETVAAQPGETASDKITAAGQRFSEIGSLTASLSIGSAVITDDFQAVYKNEIFISNFEGGVDTTETDFAAVWDRLRLYHEAGRLIPFDESPVFRSIADKQPASAVFYISGANQTVLVSSAPLTVDTAHLWLIFFIPLPSPDGYSADSRQAVDRIIQSLAHDVTAPLAVIDVFASQLQKEHAGKLNDDALQLVGSIAESGRAMRRMIDGLGELSRIHLTVEKAATVPVRELIDDLLPHLYNAYPGTQYAVTIDNTLPDVISPRNKLAAVLHQLLDNAFKFSAAASQPNVAVEYIRDGAWHRFSIVDNGPGIKADYLQMVFEPLFRAPDALTLPGSGIGLAIAYDIIVTLGGAIWCDASASGCRVVFTLPADGLDKEV